MSTRLYYTDAMLSSFEATVTTVEPDTASSRWRVTLDRTALYPTSGGQPHDTGLIDEAVVLDVLDDDEGRIIHVVDRPLEPGRRVTGRVAWARRFDHMQQHTGQHMLSAAFDRTCSVRTESFHLGTTTCTIDLAREVSAAEIGAAEQLANAVVWENRPVRVRFADEAEAASLPLRKESLRTGTLRLVDIEDFDLSACGGTHVLRTGGVGLIAVAGWERFKGGSRISFVCGGRALASHTALRNQVAGLVRHLTVAPQDLSAAVERLQLDLKTATRTVRTLQESLASQLAETLVAEAEPVGAFRRVLVVQSGWDAAAVKTLASAIVAHPGVVAVVVGEGTPAPLVVARAVDVSFDAGACVKHLTTALGGRGGGRPELAQGAAPDAVRILELAREIVK